MLAECRGRVRPRFASACRRSSVVEIPALKIRRRGLSLPVDLYSTLRFAGKARVVVRRCQRAGNRQICPRIRLNGTIRRDRALGKRRRLGSADRGSGNDCQPMRQHPAIRFPTTGKKLQEPCGKRHNGRRRNGRARWHDVQGEDRVACGGMFILCEFSYLRRVRSRRPLAYFFLCVYARGQRWFVGRQRRIMGSARSREAERIPSSG